MHEYSDLCNFFLYANHPAGTAEVPTRSVSSLEYSAVHFRLSSDVLPGLAWRENQVARPDSYLQRISGCSGSLRSGLGEKPLDPVLRDLSDSRGNALKPACYNYMADQ